MDKLLVFMKCKKYIGICLLLSSPYNRLLDAISVDEIMADEMQGRHSNLERLCQTVLVATLAPLCLHVDIYLPTDSTTLN